MTHGRIQWYYVINEARRIVTDYHESGTEVTLRQLFYRLVADGWIPNTKQKYTYLSKLTAKHRRNKNFPDLIDNVRDIHGHATWRSPHHAFTSLIDGYRRDRTEYQEYAVYVGCEKATMIQQLLAWFGDDGLPILAFSGYASQTYVDQVIRRVQHDGREAILLYAGDFDPSGEDILRDFDERTSRIFEVVRVALTADQVSDYDLPVAMGKRDDSRSGQFVRRHGELVQVELEALDPQVLRELYDDALEPYWDEDAYDRSVQHEKDDIEQLKEQ